MSLPLTPLNELDAVNILLAAIGEQPVNSLTTSGVSLVSIAQQTLHQTSRQTQALGLNCNSESRYPIVPNVNGEIVLPQNTLKADASDVSKDYVIRGRRLYDRANHTYNIGKTVEVDIVFFLPFTDLPQVVRDYITVKAARVFQQRFLGSESLHQFNAQDEHQAYIALVQEEIDTGDYNLLNSPDAQMMLRRSV